jgi:hypothetical protein
MCLLLLGWTACAEEWTLFAQIIGFVRLCGFFDDLLTIAAG